MRTFIFEWGPDGAGDGLVPALERQAVDLKNDSDLVVDVYAPANPLPLTSTTQTHLNGIVREALVNAAKHSGSRGASVHVDVHDDRVIVEVVDGGRGFDADIARPGHYGLESMRSRAREINATLSVGSKTPGGTTVRVEVPVEADAHSNGG
jgi:signal transduction histidine kinase